MSGSLANRTAVMMQEQVAQAMGTTQAVVARLESGTTMPRTLERFAKATGTKLRIRFEPAGVRAAREFGPGLRCETGHLAASICDSHP